MRAVIQRVTSAKVEVEGKVTGEIGKGFLILFGVGQEDTEADCDKLADKISKLRIFADENDKTNLSINDVGGDILCVSQFTLYADCHHGNRPSFIWRTTARSSAFLMRRWKSLKTDLRKPCPHRTRLSLPFIRQAG